MTRNVSPIRISQRALLAVLVGVFPGCGDAPQPSSTTSRIGVVGLKTPKMNFSAAQQQGWNWCWAASIQMVLSTKDIDVTQQDVVRNAFGQVIDRPGSQRDILENLNGWAINRGGKRILVSGDVGIGKPSFELLKRQLEAGTPVIIGYENPGYEMGHAVVVTAVIYEITGRGPEIQRVMVRDPWPTCPNHGKRELNVEEFNRVSHYYVIHTTL